MPAIMVTVPTVTQDLLFSSLICGCTITNTRFAYSWRDGQVELAWVVD